MLIACQYHPPPSVVDQIRQRGVVRVAMRTSPTTFTVDAQGKRGFEFELAQQFARELDVQLQVLTRNNLDEVYELLSNGEADLIAGSYRNQRPSRDDSEFDHLLYGPVYQQVKQQVIFKQGKTRPFSPKHLRNKNLVVLANASYTTRLLEWQKQYADLNWEQTTELESAELMDLVLNESIDYTIANSNELSLARRFFPELMVGFNLDEPLELAWTLRKSADDSLYIAMVEFFGVIYQNGTLAQLLDRYYGHVKRFSVIDTQKFIKDAKTVLPKYKKWFQVAAGTDLDWRLLAAQSYQESHWNPRAKSKTGVRGIMQITLHTAKEAGVSNRLNAKQSIFGGARYLKKLKMAIPKRIQEPDRSWMALAAYNVGFGHLEDARKLVQQRGGNADTWVDVKKNLPLLQKKKWYKKTKHGYARGQEPVSYVDNIRRYYETLIWLLEQEAQEAELQDNGKISNKSG